MSIRLSNEQIQTERQGMLFCDRLSQREMIEAKKAGRETLLELILSDFRKTFPSLTFELQLNFSSINALAMRLQDRRSVTIYGGLALHPNLAADSFTFVLLHEAGHHLADGCRLVRDPALACECAADYWALTKGSEQLQHLSGRYLNISAALEELSAVMGARQKLQVKYPKRKNPVCWAEKWALRSRALRQRTRPPTNIGSCVTYS
jgi:hypothetical protein